jgi:uncharacterized protein YndB with AHSA1/START domain
MKWILRIIVILIAVIVLLSVVGLLFPRDQSFTRSVQIAQPPQAVWNVLTDCITLPSWRPEVTICERMPDENGHAIYRLISRSGGATTIEVDETIPHQSLAIRVLGIPAGGKLTWIFNLTSMNGGTQVSLTQNDSMADLPARIFFRASVRTQKADTFLRELAAKFAA